MQYEVVGKFLVLVATGEIVEPTYEVVNTQASTDDKRFYSATSLTAHECVDPEQLADVMKHTVDQRGLQVKTDLTWLKKESDYGVRTLKNKPLISNPQYLFLKQLVECISYKNIILCKRSLLCKKLSIDEKHLVRKLKTVGSWVQQHPCRKGFIKLFVSPMVGYKGRASGIPSAYKTFYTVDKETQQRALYEPFVGPPAPYTGPVIDFTKPSVGAKQYGDDRLDFYDSAEDFTPGDWWDKPAKKKEVINVELEKWFAANVGKDISEFYKKEEEVLPLWIVEELPMFDYGNIYFEESCTNY